MGAQVVVGDLTDLHSMHAAIEGCSRLYFGMSVSASYLEATVNTAAVAKHHGVEAFINMSQMTLSQMSITETTSSPQHKLHWLAEQALNWSGLPVVHVRPTVFLEGFFLRFAASSVKRSNQLALPMGSGKTSPISADDVARAVADDPLPSRRLTSATYTTWPARSRKICTSTHGSIRLRSEGASTTSTCRLRRGARSWSMSDCRST